MSLIRRLVTSIAALLPAGAAAAGGGAVHTVTVGGTLVELAVPQGMREVAASHAAVRALVEPTVPKEMRLLACFVPEADAATLDRGGSLPWERHVLVVTLRAHEGLQRGEAEFAAFQRVTDESLQRFGPDNARVFERGPRHYGYQRVRESDGTEVGPPRTRRVVVSPSVVLVRGVQVSYFIYADYHGEDDAAWSRDTGRALMQATLRANRSPGD